MELSQSQKRTYKTAERNEAPLQIITWNINGKVADAAVTELTEHLVVKSESEIIPDVVFLQETRSVEMPEKIVRDWYAYYTQYSTSEKGVAILVNKKRHPNFTPNSQEVDRNGRYVVVQGKLGEQGEDYTLVSVYNHQEDTTTLDLLTPYLQTMAVGTLVIGGDFNTTFGINDRAKELSNEKLKCYEPNERNPQHGKLRMCVEKFMRSLQLVDVFRGKNGYGLFDETCFTYRRSEQNQKKSSQEETSQDESSKEETSQDESSKEETSQNIVGRLSRLDYFFIPEEWMGSVKGCEILYKIKRGTLQRQASVSRNRDYLFPLPDHCPLLLQLDFNLLPTSQLPEVDIDPAIQSLKKMDIDEDDQPELYENITGVEIAAAIQSLNLMDIRGRPGRPLSKYKNLNPEEMKQLKQNFNHYINTKSLPANFSSPKVIYGHYFFNVEYLIFATILAWRLEDWSWEEETSQQTDIEDWPQLQSSIRKKINNHPGTSDFDIIEKMLINETTNRIRLHKGCPLSRTLRKLFPKLRTEGS
ncbi:uncharacterized protein [Salminus brasiliensis]|uniref:uncharacterized protein n=1 Tax=Salminus brasiliensis TaxID=930266 RepID=UPI003B839C1A